MSCACNELCQGVPRSKIGLPSDVILWRAGVRFSGEVILRDWRSAIRTMDLIKARAHKIRKEIQSA
jgi:hypothetical protein